MDLQVWVVRDQMDWGQFVIASAPVEQDGQTEQKGQAVSDLRAVAAEVRGAELPTVGEDHACQKGLILPAETGQIGVLDQVGSVFVIGGV